MQTFNIRFHDSQQIQILQDTLLRVSHMLDLNISILTGLLSLAQSKHDLHPSAKRHMAAFTSLLSQITLDKQRAENLLRRLDGTSKLVR
jgi:hypothetical protein